MTEEIRPKGKVGRKPVPEAKQAKCINVSIPRYLYDELENMYQGGEMKSRIVQDALREYFERRQNY